jgi:hypothetical protein
MKAAFATRNFRSCSRNYTDSYNHSNNILGNHHFFLSIVGQSLSESGDSGDPTNQPRYVLTHEVPSHVLN